MVHVWFDDDQACHDAYHAPWGVRKFLTGERLYYVALMNMALMKLVRDEQWEPFVTINNDQEFFVPGWDTIAKSALKQKFGDSMGVVEIGDSIGFTSFISLPKFWQEHYGGNLFDPKFKQYFADAARLAELSSKDQFGRLSPGLVQTYVLYDEVKAEGLKMWERDCEAQND